MRAFERSTAPGIGAAAQVSSGDVLTLAERSRHLIVLRSVGVTAVLGVVIAWPSTVDGPFALLLYVTAAYVGLCAGAAIVVSRWPARRVTLPILQGGLLIDGVYLVTAVTLTGGVTSPLMWLIPAHLVATTLLASYRTGLKLALWDTLLIMVALRAVADGIVPGGDAASDASGAAAIAIAGLWVVTMTTAACAAASERMLRAQRADFSALSSMAARIEERPTAAEIPIVLLDELCATFGFPRGVVLLGGARGLRVAAATDGVATDGVRAIEGDAITTTVLEDASPQLVRSFDRTGDGALSALLPDARNIAILPLAAPSGPSFGTVMLERGGRAHGIPRWTIAMIERFVAHAALALANARLRDERDAQLTTIQLLEQDVRAHAVELEERVAARTAELRETIAILRETDEQRQRLLEHVVRAAEEERQRIANDVHDDPVQKLIALKMRLELVAKAYPDDDDVAHAKTTVEGVIHSMRHLLFDLRPPVLGEAAFDEALRYLLEQSELPFAWSVEGAADPEPSEQTRVILYRIVQEAVANARKHSEAERLLVRLGSRDDGTWVEITDDGIGFRPQEAVVAAPGHLGLAAMRERAEMAGGTCELRSLPGAGTTVTVWLPREDEVRPEPIDLGSRKVWRQAKAS